ncbi:TetR/AcrR family transcriptional regulator [Streptomyces gilvus]|uniref:TetR/AcrR family transcriptional regulator n=1 Tax=Streptomyces gilvus TaxID=2920937 RepID=UPI001F0DF791|nr:TetR/AcrR family transcriptional regulator [Streptomyces sp. CME 23]MCH5676598.1 TetR/AcrR family transcriptional regulator [Streptomyces sp. CME 23]
MPSRSEGLRADAARNRELILSAARTVFAEQGLGASMRQIAARAGVGEPTLRRRFASKEDLVAEAFEDKITVYADLARDALDEPEPGEGLFLFLEQVARMQLVDRGFAAVLTMTFPKSMRCEQERRRAFGTIQRLVTRAQEAGTLRQDFVTEDIVMLLLSHAGVVAGSGALAEQFSARLLAYARDAVTAPGPRPLPPAPSPARVYKTLMGLHETR